MNELEKTIVDKLEATEDFILNKKIQKAYR